MKRDLTVVYAANMNEANEVARALRLPRGSWAPLSPRTELRGFMATSGRVLLVGDTPIDAKHAECIDIVFHTAEEPVPAFRITRIDNFNDVTHDD